MRVRNGRLSLLATLPLPRGSRERQLTGERPSGGIPWEDHSWPYPEVRLDGKKVRLSGYSGRPALEDFRV